MERQVRLPIALSRAVHVDTSTLPCIDSAFLQFRRNETMMAKRPRIAVVGSANIDLTTFAERFPKPGETIFGQKFDLGFGGKGANQAVAARLCGADVFMVARVGSDLFGPATIENFKRLGDRKSTRLNSSHRCISYAVFCLKKTIR